MLKTNDFIAVLKYRPMGEGGRKTPAKSGHRAQIQLTSNNMQTFGDLHFINKEYAMPGEIITAEIKIGGVEFFAHLLTEDMSFEFAEGNKVIGTGVISTILNEKLRKQTHQEPLSAPVIAPHESYGSAIPVITDVAKETKTIRIRKTAGMSLAELEKQIALGARIVIYGYCISTIFLTFPLISAPYFIRIGEHNTRYRLKYNLTSLLLGWWGLPWGPVKTLGMLRANSTKLGGGTDVTEDVLTQLRYNAGTFSDQVFARGIVIEYTWHRR